MRKKEKLCPQETGGFFYFFVQVAHIVRLFLFFKQGKSNHAIESYKKHRTFKICAL